MENVVCREVVEELREEWRRLWRERVDDKVRAEGIADKDYSLLFVDKGTVIFATRSFRMLNFREVLERHKIADVDRVVGPSPSVGGWGKFVRTMVVNRKPSGRVIEARKRLGDEKRRQHLRKGGRGWLRV